MDLHTWLGKRENNGKASWLAEQLGCSKAAVSLWKAEGVPMTRMQCIAELIGPPVTVDDMLRHALACKTAPEITRDP